MRRIGLVAGAILAVTSAANAGTILEYTAGTFVTGGPLYPGESFTTPSGGPWDDITFNFYESGLPAAFGTGFLLDQSYAGQPSALSSSTPGFLASATASGGEYSFASSLVLQPDTTYYLYSNSSDGPLDGGPSSVAGITNYFSQPNLTTNATTDFAPSTGVLNFLVAGTVASSSVPEPSSVWLVLPALGGIALYHRRQRRG
jgi:hypothetical protein